MTEVSSFLDQIENFIAERENWSPTRFGKEMANDPRFVFQLRDGREPRRRVRDRVIEKMTVVLAAENSAAA